MKIIPGKYLPFRGIELSDRRWPSNRITHPPIWASVDLRDGNQALAKPMDVEQKLEMFKALVGCGFKEIEVGFPSANDTEFTLVRRLIEEHLIPDDVTIQVLVQSREHLIARTVESLVGAKRATIHLYNSTSPAQRRVVFKMEKSEVLALGVQGTKWIKKYAASLKGTDVTFEYSPESFSATETEFALDVCEAVMAVWGPTSAHKMIFNLPETVEVATPNVYADQVEWFCRHISHRSCIVVSLHTHNDRGTGVAAAELGMLAGADRVEGTLFGNGERTGNMCVVTAALNMFAQGIDPELDFSNIDSLREVYERCTVMQVPPRHPYAGELVFTAFSGSHQDAIRKGFEERQAKANSGVQIQWDVPYLHIDPRDIGRKYEEVIRVNNQSGKGGVGYLLEQARGIRMPKKMEIEFGTIAGKKIDALGREVNGKDLWAMFEEEYLLRTAPYTLEYSGAETIAGKYSCRCRSEIVSHGNALKLDGVGNGPIDAFVNSLHHMGIDVRVLDQAEHALGEGQDASAIAYICLQFSDGTIYWGAGIDTDIEQASIKAIVSALNRK